MSDRTRNGKTFAQDALGFLFCLVGGFFAVSIVLSMRGQEPKPGLISALTWPVVELDTLLGHGGALLFSGGLAVLGTMLFLRSTPFDAQRPLLALLFGSLGVALLFGVFGGQGELGAWLPGLVPGVAGRVLAGVLGLALAWVGWTLLAVERAPRSSSAELIQRVGLAARHDAASGVSPAEAALLVSEPRSSEPRTQTRPAPRREAFPIREETIRPFVPHKETTVSEPRTTRLETPSAPARESAEAFPILSGGSAERSSGVSELPNAELAPPAASWEGLQEEALADEQEDEVAQPLATALSGEFETEEEDALEDEEEPADEAEAEGQGAGELSAAPRASWEQIGLFDEEEEVEEEEAPPVASVQAELTPAFDFGPPELEKPVHEPEPSAEDPFALASAPVSAPEAALEPELDEEEEEEDEEEKFETSVAPRDRAASVPAAPAVQQEFLLQPVPAPRPERSETRDEEGESWSKLVYDAGCTILEQKRVAVSMLERRFGIDFEQACRVLDELQHAGLIGPYMGGRTRDILLTREQWLPHAPQTS
jgi:hypothetical protein